jgi:phage terminase large subunit-like protein
MQKFKLTAKQQEAWSLLAGDSTHIMLFGGSRSGKTFLLCRAVAMRAMKAAQSRHCILRFRFNHVKQSVVLDTWPKMMALCFPGVEAPVNRTDWYARFPNGSEVWFGGLDEKERVDNILGKEYSTIYLNECSQIPQSSRDTALTRLAQSVVQDVDGQPLTPRMYYDCNPPTKAHWSYRLFVRKEDLDTKRALNNPADYTYFQINPADNQENLAAGYLNTLQSLGARYRKRFLLGEFSDATDNSLFDDATIDKWRVTDADNLPDMLRVVVAVDPSGSGDKDNADNDAIGIIVAGLGTDGNGYCLEDLTVKAGPATWGKVAVDAFDRWQANVIVAEQNFGGDMVRFVIQSARMGVPYKSVTASRGKHVRAEPVSSLCDTGKVRMAGYFRDLEDELVGFTVNGYVGEKSPNRADAFVWAFTELFGKIVNPAQEKPKEIRKPQKMTTKSWMG